MSESQNKMDPLGIIGTSAIFRCVGKVVDAACSGIGWLFGKKSKEEQAAETAEKVEATRHRHARELAETENKNKEAQNLLLFQQKREEREASFQNDLIKMREQAKIAFEAKEYEYLQKTFPLMETTERFRNTLHARLERCANNSRRDNKHIPAPNLFLMLPQDCKRFCFFDTLEFSQFTTSLRMLTSQGTYSASGPTPYFNYVGAWQQAHEFQNFNSVQKFWEISSFYPTIIVQPCYSSASQIAQLNVYYWGVNSQETQESPNHLAFAEMSIDEYRKQLFENVDANMLKNGEFVSQTVTRGVFAFYRLLTATAVAQFIDGYYYRANGTLPQFLSALKESFPDADAFQTFPWLKSFAQDALLTVLNDLKFDKKISNFKRALKQINSPGFFFQGEEELASWTKNILQELKEEKTATSIANNSIYLPY